MALFKIFLFDVPSKQKSDNSFPVTLKVTYKGKRKYFYLGFDALPSQWNKSKSCFNSKYSNHSDCNQTLNEHLSNAEAVRKEMAIEGQEFSLSEFEKRFRASGDGTLSRLFSLKINDLNKPLATSTKGRYLTTLNMLLQYKGDIQIREVNETYIFGFIKWLQTDRNINVKGNDGQIRNIFSPSCNDTTVYNYLKDFRSVYNFALKRRLVSKNINPFEQININKYKIETSKRAISIEQFTAIEKLQLDTTYGNLARDIFMFSFYCRGINFADTIKLKPANIFQLNDGYYLEYYRSKTNKRFTVKLRSKAEALVNKYLQDSSIKQRGYIFPILDETVHTSEKKILNRKKSMLKKINKALNEEIAPLIGLESIHLTTYISRHSYANELNKNDIPLGKISQALGHRSQEVTKVYLKSIADYELEKIDEKIFGV